MSEPGEVLRPTDAWAGKRVDAWLAAQFPAFSMAAIRKLLAARAVRKGGKICAKGDRVCPGEAYTLLHAPEAEATLQANPELPVAVLYEDEVLLAVDKAAGMDCQPNGPEETETLANGLLARYPELRGIGDGPLTCGILHRIDRETSGLVLVARTQSAYEALRAQFSAHTVVKRYLALASGEITRPGRLEHWLAHNPRCPGRMVDASVWRDVKRPMRAVSEFRPLRVVPIAFPQSGTRPYTLLEVSIQTGVTHQIRAQLSLAGMPLLGDKRYGGAQMQGFPRHFLHAAEATFCHPATGQKMTLRAPLPPDLARICQGRR